MKRLLISLGAALLIQPGLAATPLFQLADGAPFSLAGTNVPAGTVSVLVAGEPAEFHAETHAWSRRLTLPGGHHSLQVRFLGSDGRWLGQELRDVVVETKTTQVGGALTGSRHWTTNDGIIRLTHSVLVTEGGSLTLDPGVVVLLAPGASLQATNASLVLQGTAEQPVHLLPADGSTVWGELAVDGPLGLLELHHAEVAAGAVKIRQGAVGWLEDSSMHHYKSGGVAIAGCTRAKSVTVRRCHFNVYHETLWQFTPMLVEDSLFENADNPSSDALDFDAAPVGSVIRRCTFQHGPETNTDAIDIGSESQGVLIEDCVMWDFPHDKAVSIGENSFGIVVRNCLMVGCDSGVAVKDGCRASVEHCTIVDCDFGFRLYNKANPAAALGGGHITNAVDNILWGNQTTLSLLNGSTLVAARNDFADLDWPGEGNVQVDPLFRDRANLDYRLAAQSAVRGRAAGGSDLGVHFPVGRQPPAPQLRVQRASTGDFLESGNLTAGFTYLIESREILGPGDWSVVERIRVPVVPGPFQLPMDLDRAQRFYRLYPQVP